MAGRLVFITLLLGLFLVHTTAAQDDCPVADGVITIAWIPKALSNPVFEIGREGAEVRAAELSEESPCEVEIFYTGPMDTVAEEQADLLNELVTRGEVDAIAVSCIEPDTCIEPINAAVDVGIPIMTWDSDSPESERLTYLGVDNYEGGRAAADLLVRVMGEEGEVAVLTGVPGSLNLEERVRGFLEGLVIYPGIRVVHFAYSHDSTTIGVEAVEQTMTDYPDLNGWFFAGLWPLFAGRGAMPQWEAASELDEMVTTGFDTLPVQLEFMQDGYLHGLVGQKYWGWGYDSVTMLHDHIVLGAEFEDFTDSGMDIVTLNNVDAMLEAWENNDFSQPLPPPFDESDSDD